MIQDVYYEDKFYVKIKIGIVGGMYNYIVIFAFLVIRHKITKLTTNANLQWPDTTEKTYKWRLRVKTRHIRSVVKRINNTRTL
jgi:hypothetical protein